MGIAILNTFTLSIMINSFMMRYIQVLLLFVAFLIPFFSFSEIIPRPGSRLNYTQIMFEHDKVRGADEYVIEVFHGNEGQNPGYLAASHKDSSLATIIGGLEFGNRYQWRFAGLSKGKNLGWNGPYNFDSAYYSYNAAINIVPRYPLGYNNLGVLFETAGYQEYASYYYNKSVEMDPSFVDGVQNHNRHTQATGLDIKELPKQVK